MSIFITHITPLTYGTIAIVVGIIVQYYTTIFLSSTLIIIALLGAYIYQANYRYILTLLRFFVIGIAWAHLHDYLQHTSLHNIMAHNTCSIAGHIIDIQRSNHQLFRYKTALSIDSINATKHPFYNPYRIIHIYTTKKPCLEIGDAVLYENTQIKTSPDSSYQQYLMREYAIGSCFKVENPPILLHRPALHFGRWLYNMKHMVIQKTTQQLSQTAKDLFLSVFLGNKQDTSSDYDHTKNIFKRWGLSHYLARSGLHLVLLIIMWQALLRCIPLSFLLKEVITTIIILLYTYLSWSSISFMRAMNSFLLYKLCFSWWRTYHNSLHLIALGTCFVLFLNPTHIWHLDFQLSFGITAALALLNIMQHHLKKRA